MDVTLVRSNELDKQLYRDIFELLAKHEGWMRFHPSDRDLIFDEEDLKDATREGKERFRKEFSFGICKCILRPREVDWKNIFDTCKSHRRDLAVEDDHHMILLTDHENEYNWFSSQDPEWNHNYFVQTSGWDLFTEAERKYPIVHEIISLLLQRSTFHDFKELTSYAHKQPRGCINDLCSDKREATFKLRTGDICQECIEKMIQREVDPRQIEQTFRVLDGIRREFLFRERYKVTMRPSRLLITGQTAKIFLVDLDHTEVKMTPLEKTIFLFYLRHPEGVPFTHLSDHRQEIYDIYSQVSNAGTITELNNRVDSLVYNQDDSLSQKISRIKSRFEQIVGPAMAEHYIILGERGEERKIKLDRNLVEFQE